MTINVGAVIRAPWRHYGDDANLTGSVIRARRDTVIVRWNADGTVTPQGDESEIRRDILTDDDVVRS